MRNTYSDPKQIRNSIGRESMKKFHHVSSARGILSILIEWSLIIALATLCEMYFFWPTYALCIVIIGARLLALGLIMHEGVHNLVSKNKGLNDCLSEIFCAWPLFISMRSYRIKHLAHHSWLNTDRDPDFIAKTNPDWRYPMKGMKFLKVVLVQLSGLGIFETFSVMSSAQMKTKKAKTPAWYHLARIGFYVTIIASFIAAGKGMILLMYWIIPFATWTQVANRLRRVAEHSGIEDKSPAMQTRTTIHGLLGRLLLAPKNISFHNEHHLYPGVPCYYLPKVHVELTQEKDLKDNLHISKTYKDVYAECILKAE